MEANINDNILITIGNNVTLFMKEHNISSYKLLKYTGLDNKNFKKILNGKSLIRRSTIIIILDFLREVTNENITFSQLLKA